MTRMLHYNPNPHIFCLIGYICGADNPRSTFDDMDWREILMVSQKASNRDGHFGGVR